MKLMKKLLGLSLAVLAVVGLTACVENEENVEGGYIYRSYTSALATNWNPHTWETNADSAFLSYIESPFVDLSIKDSTTGEYQWVYEMATSIEDVTEAHQDDLTKFGSALPSGVSSVSEVTAGYVYEIKLNENAKWQDGDPINADDYIYSMQQFLAPELQNYRANNYYSGESAIAGAYEYYNQGKSDFFPATDFDASVYANETLYLDLNNASFWSFMFGDPDAATAYEWAAPYGYFSFVDANGETVDFYAKYSALVDENGRLEVTDSVKADIQAWASSAYFGWPWAEENLAYFVTFLYTFPTVSYDTVGLYKVDDYTIRYVCKNSYDYYYFLTSMTSNWLLHEKTYEACKNFDNDIYTSTYNTSVETTVSYGVYKMTSLQEGKQVVFEQNENWYGFTKLEDGSLYSETPFTVDGKKVQQYQTTKIVIDVMTPDAAKLAFESGQISDYAPSASELPSYTLSDQLYQSDETYTMRLFFNTNLEALQEMDKSKGNQNSVVMSNYNFRKAFSLSVDRSDWVTTTAGYKPAYSLINSLYYYNVYEDPTSIYRNTDEAMQSIVDLYGITYGEGQPYATLEEAYKAVTGYNLDEAQQLMKTAHDELVAANLYTSGQDIKIRVAWKAGAPDSDDYAQLAKLESYLNAAVAGSGFGKVTLELVGNLTSRYEDVPNGEYAIGYGAWGGAAFYPFTMFRVYMDPSYTKIHEAGCWDPATETLTLYLGEVDEEGNPVPTTMTYQAWSQSLSGNGPYANADFETQLYILSQLEKEYIGLYYAMPLATSTVCSLLSYQVSYYTENYNIMYGYGGIRLMSYNYDNVEWHNYVKSQGGTLNYN